MAIDLCWAHLDTVAEANHSMCERLAKHSARGNTQCSRNYGYNSKDVGLPAVCSIRWMLHACNIFVLARHKKRDIAVTDSCPFTSYAVGT